MPDFDPFTIHLTALTVIACLIARAWYRWHAQALTLRLAVARQRAPLVGGIAALARNPALAQPMARGLPITRAEVQFARSVLPLIPKRLTAERIDHHTTYRGKADDAWYLPDTPPGWLSLCLMLMIPEALAAGYILTPWISAEITVAALDAWAAIAGYTFAGVTFAITHTAGKLFAHASADQAQLRNWRDDPAAGPLDAPPISLNDAQHADDGARPWRQYFSRCQRRASYRPALTLMAVVLLLGLSIACLRVVAASAPQAEQEHFLEQLAKVSGIEAPNPETSAIARLGRHMGNAVSIGIFTLAYFGVQGLSLMLGGLSAHNAPDTPTAYRLTNGFRSHDMYEDHRNRVIQSLEKPFAELQARLRIPERAVTPSLRAVLAHIELDARAQDFRARLIDAPAPANDLFDDLLDEPFASAAELDRPAAAPRTEDTGHDPDDRPPPRGPIPFTPRRA